MLDFYAGYMTSYEPDNKEEIIMRMNPNINRDINAYMLFAWPLVYGLFYSLNHSAAFVIALGTTFSTLFTLLDNRLLCEYDIPKEKRPWVLMGILVPPIYAIQRLIITKAHPAYYAVCIITLIFGVMAVSISEVERMHKRELCDDIDTMFTQMELPLRCVGVKLSRFDLDSAKGEITLNNGSVVPVEVVNNQ